MGHVAAASLPRPRRGCSRPSRIVALALVVIYAYLQSWRAINNGNGVVDPNLPHNVSSDASDRSESAAGDYAAEEDIFATEGDHTFQRGAVPRRADEPRVLLYITTHWSEQHEYYLRACWKKALENSPLLRGADVRVYLNPASAERRGAAVRLLNETFPDQNLTVHVRSSTVDAASGREYREQKQAEAVSAMTQSAVFGWFDGYSWVIRLNPDVIVRDDKFLVDTIRHDKNATALLINCDWRKKATRAHTDFFAIKPGALPTFLHPMYADGKKNAEYSFTYGIRSILDSGGHRWIRDAFPGWNKCKAGNLRPWTSTPITHLHFDDLSNTSVCPVPFAADEK